MKTLFCQQAAEYTYEKFRENVSTAHIMIMVPGQFAEKKICIDRVSGFGFLRIREDQTSEHEGIYRCDFSPLYYIVQKFCLSFSCFSCGNFC